MLRISFSALTRKSVAFCLASCAFHLPSCSAFNIAQANRKSLSSMTASPSRGDAEKVFLAAVSAVDPEQLAQSAIEVDGDSISVAGKELPVDNGIHLIAFGKASLRMARGAERKLGAALKRGVIVCQPSEEAEKAKEEGFKSQIVTGAAGNLPDEGAVTGATKAAEIATMAGEGEAIIVLVSGGGSALLPLPADGVPLADKLAATKALQKAGASIDELNTVRKHLSKVKGGLLAATAYPATAIGLVLSDVIGDPLDFIASGPTVADTTTHADALRVVESLNARASLPPSVLRHLESGAKGEDGVAETPKEGDLRLQRAVTTIIGSNRLAAEAAVRASEALGYDATVDTLQLQGDTASAAMLVAGAVRRSLERKGTHRCVIFAGETTVMLPHEAANVKPAKGGRATHLALLVAKELDGVEGWTLLCGATDGQDGPTDAAGALVDGGTMRRGSERGCDIEDAIARCDSYHFFEQEGGLYRTGLTGTNVMDLHVLLVAGQP